MPKKKNHDLFNFMRQITDEMSSEYNRIQMRATEDPGTAGDQGEENWAELLRGWLPRNYKVVTKGRIICQDGVTSPQIDVLVLNGSYPRKLLNKKLYLAAGVAAAFECKTTLKASHIEKAFETCIKVKRMYQQRTGSPYRELHAPIIYGLLAHSHSWKREKSSPEDNIESKLHQNDSIHVKHPREQLDLLCVADLAAWNSSKITFLQSKQAPDWNTTPADNGPNGSSSTAYIGHLKSLDQQFDQFTPIGVLVASLSQKLAHEDPSLRNLADYYRVTNISGPGKGTMRMWPSSIYSDEIRNRVESGKLRNGKPWDEWNNNFT